MFKIGHRVAQVSNDFVYYGYVKQVNINERKVQVQWHKDYDTWERFEDLTPVEIGVKPARYY